MVMEGADASTLAAPSCPPKVPPSPGRPPGPPSSSEKPTDFDEPHAKANAARAGATTNADHSARRIDGYLASDASRGRLDERQPALGGRNERNSLRILERTPPRRASPHAHRISKVSA